MQTDICQYLLVSKSEGGALRTIIVLPSCINHILVWLTIALKYVYVCVFVLNLFLFYLTCQLNKGAKNVMWKPSIATGERIQEEFLKLRT